MEEINLNNQNNNSNNDMNNDMNNDKSIEDNIRVLNQLKFDFNNTVASKSISKQELIVKFNQLFI